jgi:hypothetical protein
MPKTKLLLLCALFASACAGGDGDDTNAEDTTGGSVDPSTSTDPSMTDPSTTMTTGMTMTTAPTTAETLTTDDSLDSSGTDDASTGEPVDLSCENYCSIYLSSCADFSEYANEADCLSNCMQWPVGTEADIEGDSLGCRLYHVTVASQTEPDMHCPHAGPAGAGICIAELAPDCDTYCADFMANCTGDLYTYEDNDDCLEQCGTWYPGTAKDTAGHTVGCHTYHAGAAMAGPEEHCPHAGAGGGGICVLP